jgi:hypothetical protein
MLPADGRDGHPGPAEGAGGPPLSRLDAQRRADRIAAFRAELADLSREGVLALSPDQRDAVERHHEATLAALADRFDVDASAARKQLSLGMRIASFLGAMALAASAVLYFRHVWGALPTAVQVAILVAAPLAGLAGTDFAARRERSGYFASLLALVTLACFVLDLTALGSIFNLLPSPNAFLAWGAFGLVLAYAYGLRLPLAGGVAALAVWSAGVIAASTGLFWTAMTNRPETFLPAGFLLFALPFALAHRRRADFPPVYRIAGLVAILLPVLILANEGGESFLSLGKRGVEIGYQIAGFLLAGGAVVLGIRRRLADTVYTASAFFAAFLFTKYVDWWWDWMPHYLFFLVVGLSAVAILWLLHRLRAATASIAPTAPTAPAEATA